MRVTHEEFSGLADNDKQREVLEELSQAQQGLKEAATKAILGGVPEAVIAKALGIRRQDVARYFVPPDLRMVLFLRRAGYPRVSALAEATGIKQANLTRILGGHRFENAMTTLTVLADRLNLTLEDLVEVLREIRLAGRSH